MPYTLHFDLGQGGLGLLATIGSIILIDIVLSGDNALVIGAAASRLPRGLRFLAIVWGGVGAIVLRIIFATIATFLLLVPLLQAIGGVVLMVIAIRLLLPQEGPHIQARDRFLPAVATILIADATMSLDNVIAIGALAKGDVTVLAIGLLFSMLALFLASAVIARLIERLSILLDLASLVLAYTAANLVVADPLVGARITPFLAQFNTGPLSGTLLLNLAFVLLILLVDIWLRARARHAGIAQAAGGDGAEPSSAVAPPTSGVAARVRTDDQDLRDSAQFAWERSRGEVNGSARYGAELDGTTPSLDDPLAKGRAHEPIASHPLTSNQDAGDTLDSEP